MDVWAMDAARFGFATPGYVRAKTREVYERRYTLTKPNEHLPAARPLRVTPLYDRLAQAGAAWGAQSGWEYPTHFARPGTPPERPSWTRSDAFPHVRAECLAVRDAAGVFETSPYAKFMVEGAGALAWLQAVTPNALPARDGRVGLMPLVSASGRLAGDLTVTRLRPDRLLLVGSPQAEFLYARMLADPPEGVRVANLTEAWGGLAVSGPEAPAILAELGIDLPLFGAAFVDVGAARALALRISFTGEAGAEIYAPASVLRPIHDAVLEAGTPRGLRPLRRVGAERAADREALPELRLRDRRGRGPVRGGPRALRQGAIRLARAPQARRRRAPTPRRARDRRGRRRTRWAPSPSSRRARWWAACRRRPSGTGSGGRWR
jgi:dimethylglycine dehydrogenase